MTTSHSWPSYPSRSQEQRTRGVSTVHQPCVPGAPTHSHTMTHMVTHMHVDLCLGTDNTTTEWHNHVRTHELLPMLVAGHIQVLLTASVSKQLYSCYSSPATRRCHRMSHRLASSPSQPPSAAANPRRRLSTAGSCRAAAAPAGSGVCPGQSQVVLARDQSGHHRRSRWLWCHHTPQHIYEAQGWRKEGVEKLAIRHAGHSSLLPALLSGL